MTSAPAGAPEPPEEFPAWLPAWCASHLGSEPVELLFGLRQCSTVVAVRLADGREVVVKARPNDGRAAACVTAQAAVAGQGFPCARPLTAALAAGSSVVHAEEYRPGGEVLPGDSPEVAQRYAQVFARLTAALGDVEVDPPLPNPRWVRWDHSDGGLWPTIGFLDAGDQDAVPAHVVDAAARARVRLVGADLSPVLGHADFEAQNLRWRDGRLWVVHDWDSLAWQPEAALVGAAAAVFSRGPNQPNRLVPLASTEAFLSAYELARGRGFTAEERQVAWAAGVWTAAHNARWEALQSDRRPVSGEALRAQAGERLRRAHV